jgi:hypothetical protein
MGSIMVGFLVRFRTSRVSNRSDLLSGTNRNESPCGSDTTVGVAVVGEVVGTDVVGAWEGIAVVGVAVVDVAVGCRIGIM